MKLRQRLRGLPDRLAPQSLLDEIDKHANELRETTTEKARETEHLIESGVILAELHQSLLDWQALNRQAADLAQSLARQATAVAEQARLLRDEQTRWEQTYNQIKADESESPAELVDLTSKALSEIHEAMKLADGQRNRIVALQQTVAAQGSIISGEIERIRKVIADSQRSLLVQDSPPLWKIHFRSPADETAGRLSQKSYAIEVSRLALFLNAKRRAFRHRFLIVAALALFITLNRRMKASLEASDQTASRAVFHRPASLALLVGLAATMPLLPEAPISARGVVDLLSIIPVLRLLMPRLQTPFRRMLLSLVLSLLTWELLKFLRLVIWIRRDLLAIFIIAVVSIFYWLARKASRESSPLQRGATTALVLVHAGLLLIGVSLLANIFGYVGLSDLIGNGALVGAYRGVALYTVFVVGTSIVSFTLQTERVRNMAVIRTRAATINRWLTVGLALTTTIVWLQTVLNLFSVRDDLVGAVKSALNYQITVGAASLAPRNIVIFVLTLIFGYLIATITRAILGEAILPRLHLARGLPNAIATITHYVLLLLIFVLALAAGGVELSKFTILTGAFGVGLGFGLQNVVNNFVSGLILLFERPVRVGDYLEIGTITGAVTKIGFRSSTLHSFDGADLIIPNANLISQQVINWTLSGTQRRVFLRVHVAYDNDPERVRDLLLATAAGHPDVLKVPRPTALFLGFGDITLDFEVRFWAPRSEIVPELTSEVAIRLAAALRDAGIKIPVPLRQLHLKTDDVAKEVLAAPASDEEKGTALGVKG